MNNGSINPTYQEQTNNLKSLMDKHQCCIEILEAIQHFQQRIKQTKENINGFAGTFPDLKRKYINDLDTLYRCVERLSIRYVNVME